MSCDSRLSICSSGEPVPALDSLIRRLISLPLPTPFPVSSLLSSFLASLSLLLLTPSLYIHWVLPSFPSYFNFCLLFVAFPLCFPLSPLTSPIFPHLSLSPASLPPLSLTSSQCVSFLLLSSRVIFIPAFLFLLLLSLTIS